MLSDILQQKNWRLQLDQCDEHVTIELESQKCPLVCLFICSAKLLIYAFTLYKVVTHQLGECLKTNKI